MRITADTNVLVRIITEDDPQQSLVAAEELAGAEMVAIGLSALCELCWVLSRGYRVPAREVAETIRRLINGANVAMDRPAAQAGLALLEAGGDFADGAIAYEGAWLGAETFVSFDKKAVNLLAARGESARLLG